MHDCLYKFMRLCLIKTHKNTRVEYIQFRIHLNNTIKLYKPIHTYIYKEGLFAQGGNK